MTLSNIFKSIPSNLGNEVFEHIVKNDNITIERIISKGHQSPPQGWFDQDKSEWVLLIQGSATIAFKGKDDIHLTTGDHLLISAHEKHRVLTTSIEPEAIWLAVHF